jgi:hypothetical protein
VVSAPFVLVGIGSVALTLPALLFRLGFQSGAFARSRFSAKDLYREYRETTGGVYKYLFLLLKKAF